MNRSASDFARLHTSKSGAVLLWPLPVFCCLDAFRMAVFLKVAGRHVPETHGTFHSTPGWKSENCCIMEAAHQQNSCKYENKWNMDFPGGRDINCLMRDKLAPVMYVKYEDPNMEAYWNSLSAEVQSIINETGIEICSLGMLMKLGDYYQNENGRGK